MGDLGHLGTSLGGVWGGSILVNSRSILVNSRTLSRPYPEKPH